MKRPLPDYPDELIAKFLSGNATEEEKQEVAAWEESHPDHPVLLEKLKKVWYSNSKVPRVDVDKAWGILENRIINAEKGKTVLPLVPWWLKVAAVLVLGFISVLGYNLLKDKQTETVWLALKENREERLPDGSIVALREGSELIFRESFEKNVRRVRLKGEAFFDVVSDPTKPFVIELNQLTIKVLGTSFYIHESNLSIEVGVKTGEVSVSVSNKQDSREIAAGQKIRFDKATNDFEEIGQYADNRLFWKTGVLVYRDTGLEIVIEELRQIFQTDIVLEGDVSGCLLTGRFEGETLEQILSEIQLSFGLEVEYGDNIKIISGGC
jgi:transmembrane sensor